MLNISEEQFLVNLLQKGSRLDGRQPFTQRLLSIEFMKKPGSLLYCQGKTKVLVKINTQITNPKTQRPSEGFIVFHVNCQAAAGTNDQNKKTSVQLTKLLQKIIIGSNTLDPQSLCIVTGKYVWEVVINCMVVKDDGNLIDAVLNGVMVGLMDARKPLLNFRQIDKNRRKGADVEFGAHSPDYDIWIAEEQHIYGPKFEGGIGGGDEHNDNNEHIQIDLLYSQAGGFGDCGECDREGDNDLREKDQGDDGVDSGEGEGAKTDRIIFLICFPITSNVCNNFNLSINKTLTTFALPSVSLPRLRSHTYHHHLQHFLTSSSPSTSLQHIVI